jgi:hypothetical protein
MSRYSHYGEERDGYEAYENRRSHESYPYERDYSFRQGWESAEADERYERHRQEERREEEAAAERAADRRRQEREYERMLEEEYYEEPSYVEQQPQEREPLDEVDIL